MKKYLVVMPLTALLLFLATTGSQGQSIQDLLLLNNATGNLTKECVRRTAADPCPDPDVRFYLYTSKQTDGPEQVNVEDSDWLKKSTWDPSLPSVLLVHGYMGGDGLMPMVVLREAYRQNGSYNLLVSDWGALGKAPCYVAAVSNLKAVAKCTAHALSSLKNGGADAEKITCVGHSLGAHVCGLTSNYLSYKMDRIIGLDPARPLMQRIPFNKLDSGDARVVQVIHTNTGFYGEFGQIGNADFCVNSGRVQPYCENTANEQLCSHLHSICYQAESLHPQRTRQGSPCSRRCPQPPRPIQRAGHPATMGEHMADSASGMYCLSNNDPPYCLNPDVNPDYGHAKCCPEYLTSN